MTDSHEINISGLSKVDLLLALWKNQTPAAFYKMSGIEPPNFNYEKAKEAIKHYIDYYEGRAIKMDLSGDVINSRLYERDIPKGNLTVAHIVEKMRGKY